MGHVCTLALAALACSPCAATATSPGQAILSAIFDSPIYRRLVVPQARRTMVKTAEENGVEWSEALEWIREANDWDSEELPEAPPMPDYYTAPFHAYDEGNLSWEAAFEQELAGKAVGARNFPRAKGEGEAAFRDAFDATLASLGAACPDDGVVVDMGSGTGTSTRRLAEAYPRAASVTGIDLSPYMVAVGSALLRLAPGGRDVDPPEWISPVNEDARVTFICRDIARTGLADSSVDVVSLMLVIHELPPEVTRKVIAEAWRILRPGGQLWIGEMDFETNGFRKLRANPLLFSVIRSTEPYLDEYAEYHPSLAHDLAESGFARVELAAATGRHFACVATKAARSEPCGDVVIRDRREETALPDTHLATWEASSSSSESS